MMMTLIPLLILVPAVAGLAMLLIRNDHVRRVIVTILVLAIGAASVLLVVAPDAISFTITAVSDHSINLAMNLTEAAMAIFVLYVGVHSRRPLIAVLMAVQAGLMAWFEYGSGSHPEVSQNLLPATDHFSVIMALINGIVGGGICLYALGYMKEYHEVAHTDVTDRRPTFFALLFVFVGAMFGLVFSNNLTWLFFFWEITTLCSYLLIGYTRTEESRRNAQRALMMNLLGGVAFAAAIVYLSRNACPLDLQGLIDSAKSGGSSKALVLLPAALLCFAGITKSAQLPFSSWLLGAMVAPTPVSALLHSSTMVKAGVYLVLRMAPVITETKVGMLVALVGAVTFLVGSLAAITAADAKRVLAWSTVANLGLIVLCGGIGTYAAVWAGVLLIIFHAVAKCLLFLCVGLVEHKIHSRNIDAMSGLIVRMPAVAVMMLIGMAGMFLAPFGMLISKYAVLMAVVDAAPVLSVFIVFGSSATLFFWVKWMGKLVEVVGTPERVRNEFTLGEGLAVGVLSLATFLACLLFPMISSHMIVPYVTGVFGEHAASLTQGNIIIMMIMMAMVMLFPLSFIRYGRGPRVVAAYLSGANVGDKVQFLGSGGKVENTTMNNYYMRGLLSEIWLSRCGVICCTCLLAVMVVIACQ